MADLGSAFRDAIITYIKSWDPDLEVLMEVNVGARFIGTPRRLDIVVHNKITNRYIGIECKVQFSSGTAFEKLSYALDDCIAAPIPAIIAFAGPEIRDDMKSKLIMSGHGIELRFQDDGSGTHVLTDPYNLFRQRCYIELGMNWFPFATGQRMPAQLAALGY